MAEIKIRNITSHLYSTSKSVMVSKNIKKLTGMLRAVGVVRYEQVALKHAGNSAMYIDIKKAYGYPNVLVLLCKLMREKMDKRVDCIAAGGYGGLPLAGALAEKYNLKLTMVREKPKTHGRNVWIDGYIPKAGDKVWIVDDVFTTGESINQIVKILKSVKANVVGCSVVVVRTNKKILIPCKHILTIKELL